MKSTSPSIHQGLSYVFMMLLLILLSTSCKDESGRSYFSSEIDELGTAALIEEELTLAENLNLFAKDSVSEFYAERGYEPAWNNKNLREDLIETFRSAEDEGLFFKDYHGEEIKKNLDNLYNLDDRELSRLDILLTDAFYKFSDHLFYGKTNPKDLHEIWDVPREDINRTRILTRVIEDNDLDPALQRLRPSHPVYHQLIASSKEYRELREDFEGFEDIPEGDVIEEGEEDSRILQIQERLKFFGYLDEIDPNNTRNSGSVQESIKNFQEDNGIEVDGLIGNGTIRFLNKGYDKRYEQIQVNLERWRWFPRELGEHYIIVNIANYRLFVVKDNDTLNSHKTMVGTEARRTPVFSEKIDHIVLNPDWTIPPTIQNKDVIPGIRNNANYLKAKNIEVFDQSGAKVNPSRVNWSGNDVQSLTFRQQPGATNPLGRVKIMYPNEYLIYLHDTPAQALFERDARAESSGCVRVENAVDLAKYLVSDQEEYTSQEIDEIIASGKTTHIPLKQNVNVYHFYWTAWRENGNARFTADIYNYDDIIYEALQNAS